MSRVYGRSWSTKVCAYEFLDEKRMDGWMMEDGWKKENGWESEWRSVRDK